MACERYREALSDLAAGTPATGELEAHLAACASCRGELAALRRALAAVDAEMALLLAEPSPALAARIRATVAESADAEPGWRLGWRLPLGAAALAVLLATVIVARRGPPPVPVRSVTDRAATRELPAAAPAPESVIPTPGPRTQPVASVARAPSPDRREGAREPEVLVPAGEAEALERLAANLRRRSVKPDSLLVADLSTPLAEPTLREIRPLEIVPLDPAEAVSESQGDPS